MINQVQLLLYTICTLDWAVKIVKYKMIPIWMIKVLFNFNKYVLVCRLIILIVT